MNLARVALFACLLPLFLSACAPTEPVNGCVLAAARYREVVLAKRFVGASIPARIAGVHFAGVHGGHAMLVFRLEGGWWAYDDACGSRALGMTGVALPAPMDAARAAFPCRPIFFARWLD